MGHRALVLVFLVAAGCGKVDKFVDGGGDDDSVDANTTDAPAMGTVNIVAVDRPNLTATAEPGVEVFVTGADGTAGARATTDTDGHATVAVTGGDSVTTVYPASTSHETYVTTFVNVSPGDTLTVGNRPQNDNTQVGTPMTLSWPAVAGSDYIVYTPCMNGYGVGAVTSYSIFRNAWCNPTSFDVVVVARNTASGAYTHSTHLGGATWTDSGTLVMPAFVATAALTVGVAGLDAKINYVSLSASPYFGSLSSIGFGSGGQPTSGSFSTTAVMPAGPNGLLTSYYISRNGFGSQTGTEFATLSTNSHTITNPPQLKWLGEVIANASTRQVTWLEDAAGADPADYLTLGLYWYHNQPTFSDYYYWTFILPPNTPNRIVVPAFPDDITDQLLDVDFLRFNGGRLVERPDLNSWADVKALPEWELKSGSVNDPSALPGLVRTSQFYEND